MFSKISLNVCSSVLRICPEVSSKFTSVRSIPMVLGINLSKRFVMKSTLTPFPSAVPVDLNYSASIESMSKEIQYLESS